jgi:hypothetical protein
MSAENVELVRKSYERETGSLGPDWDTIAPQFEYHTLSTEPDAGIYRGHDGFKELLALWTDMFDATDAALEALGLAKQRNSRMTRS